MDRQTIRVGAVCSLLAFLLGLAFSFGGKSTSLDSLHDEVNKLSNSVSLLNKTFVDADKQTSVQIKGLEDKVTELTSKVDGLQNQVQYQAQAQADYRAAGKR